MNVTARQHEEAFEENLGRSSRKDFRWFFRRSDGDLCLCQHHGLPQLCSTDSTTATTDTNSRVLFSWTLLNTSDRQTFILFQTILLPEIAAKLPHSKESPIFIRLRSHFPSQIYYPYYNAFLCYSFKGSFVQIRFGFPLTKHCELIRIDLISWTRNISLWTFVVDLANIFIYLEHLYGKFAELVNLNCVCFCNNRIIINKTRHNDSK